MAKRKKTAKKTTKRKTSKKTAKRKATAPKKTASQANQIPKKTRKSSNIETGLILLRVSLGLFFAVAGLSKLITLFGGSNALTIYSVPIWLTWIVAVVELLGGLFITTGFLKTESSILLIIIMIVAVILSLSTGKWVAWNAILKGIFQHLIYIAALMIVMYERKKVLVL